MVSIQENVELLPFNTFKIKAKARYFTTVQSVADVQELLKSSVYQNQKRLIIGGGSNILLTRDFNGLVIKVNLTGIEIIEENDTHIILKVGSGETWHTFVMHCVNNNWGGIENLSLIPGTVGAAPMQNIGAYGIEVKEVIKKVEAVDLSTCEVKTFNNDECEFGYRESVFKQRLKEKYFISSVTLTLTKKNHHFNTSYGAIQTTLEAHGVTQLSVKEISNAVIEIRQQKLPNPKVVGNAGSFFKNPTITIQHYNELKNTYPTIPGYTIDNQYIKVPAGWLIEQCNWKGKTFDSIGVHPLQSLVLVNYGEGTGEKIWELATKILASVKEKFHVQLQPEVNVI
jgi:UDP-N-acetylmuramate dehydrogenase